MRARVFVTLKPSVFDPQGRTIAEALHSLGYGGVEDVRQGKYFELDLATTEAAQARALAAEVADKLLANPVSRAIGSKSTRRAGAGMKFAVIVFPGSNCDQDAYHAATRCRSASRLNSSGTRTPT